MKKYICLFLTSLIITGVSLAKASPIHSLPIPDSLKWESHRQEGIDLAVALNLNKSKKAPFSNPTLTVFVKNSSEDIIDFIVNGPTSGLYVFLIDNGGNKSPLRTDNDRRENRVFPKQIDPGEVQSFSMTLNSSDLKRIGTRLIQVGFDVHNVPKKKSHIIMSNPAHLLPNL